MLNRITAAKYIKIPVIDAGDFLLRKMVIPGEINSGRY
jgi:hypothetical protein